MSLASIFQTAAGHLMIRTEDAVYTPVSGSAVECKVTLNFDVETSIPGEVDIMELGTTIEGLYSEIGSPKNGSTFLVNGTTYRVKRVEKNDRVFVTVVVNAD